MADVVVDQKPMDKLPYDPNDIPDAVKKRAAAVDALYTNGSDGSTPQQPSGAESARVLPEKTPVPPQASSSVDWYRGWRDHLEFSQINGSPESAPPAAVP